MVKVAIMGFGVVGSGVAEVLDNNRDVIAENASEEIELKYILDIRDFPESPYGKYVVHDFAIIENDPEVKIVVETIGGRKIAYEYTKRCLSAGKSVVTSNKELVAECGAELIALAKEKNLNYLFEASVGGGIPIIRPLIQCLSANHINEITGILNGTTNYILTRMVKGGLGFDEALSEAKRKGYAEADPSADIDGCDACRKICILADLAFGKNISPSQVHTEGIRGISTDDAECARAAGYVIKLLGRAILGKDGKLCILVAPHFIPEESPLAPVEGVFNAITVNGDAVGSVMFYGRGAGKLPTASAVVADVIDAAKHSSTRRRIGWESGGVGFTELTRDMSCKFYVRTLLSKKSEIERLFGEVSYIDCVKDGEIAFLTGITDTKDAEKAAHELGALSFLRVL